MVFPAILRDRIMRKKLQIHSCHREDTHYSKAVGCDDCWNRDVFGLVQREADAIEGWGVSWGTMIRKPGCQRMY